MGRSKTNVAIRSVCMKHAIVYGEFYMTSNGRTMEMWLKLVRQKVVAKKILDKNPNEKTKSFFGALLFMKSEKIQKRTNNISHFGLSQ